MAYCSTADVQTYLEVGATVDADLIAALIARAQAWIDRVCHRTFEAAQDSTRTFDALSDVDGALLVLGADLCQLTSVTNGDGEAVAATEYVTVPRHETPWWGLRLKRASDVVWTYDDDAEDAITVVGRWAYSLTAPADVAHACVRLAAWLYRQRDSQQDPGQPQLTPEGNVLVPSAMPKDVQALLAPYRRLV